MSILLLIAIILNATVNIRSVTSSQSCNDSPNISFSAFTTHFDVCDSVLSYLPKRDQMMSFQMVSRRYLNYTQQYLRRQTMQALSTLSMHISRINNHKFDSNVIQKISSIHSQFISNDLFVSEIPNTIQLIYNMTKQTANGVGRQNARTLLQIFNVISSATTEWTNQKWNGLDDIFKILVISSRYLFGHYLRANDVIGFTCNPIDDWLRSFDCKLIKLRHSKQNPTASLSVFQFLYVSCFLLFQLESGYNSSRAAIHALDHQLSKFGFIPFPSQSRANEMEGSQATYNLLDVMQTYDSIVNPHTFLGRPYSLGNFHFITELNILFCYDILRVSVQTPYVPILVGTFVVNQCLSYFYRASDRGDVLKGIAPILMMIIRRNMFRMVIHQDRMYQEQIIDILLEEDPHSLLQAFPSNEFQNMLHRLLCESDTGGQIHKIDILISLHHRYNLSCRVIE